MMREISSKQIEIEMKSGYRPPAIDSGIMLLPLTELGDREFELLSYILVKQEIEDSKYSEIDDIALMQGVGERGRDCVLYRKGIVCGLIQCKKFQGHVTKPQVIREILKFLLFSLLDKELMPQQGDFVYYLYVANDLTEPAVQLLKSFQTEIEKEISTGCISKFSKDVIEEYESFTEFQEEPPEDKIEALLRAISVDYCNATDLTSRIYKYGGILSMFFNVKTVIDTASTKEVMRDTLQEFGLKLLTDEDLRALQDRIGRTREEDRINLGMVDFFGLSKSFFKFLKGDKFKELIEAVNQVRVVIQRHQIDFIQSKIQEQIMSRITVDLLNRGKIHPFSVAIAAPYLFNRLLMNVVSGSMPKAMLRDYFPHFSQTKEELISEIAELLYASSERVMKGDFSELVGNPDDIALKKKLFAHMHIGFTSINDAKKVFLEDIRIIRPVLDQIEGEVSDLIPEENTIVIKDARFFDDRNELARMAKTLKNIE